MLWPEPLRAQLLRGSPVLEEAREREAALRQEWAGIEAALRERPSAEALAEGEADGTWISVQRGAPLMHEQASPAPDR